MYIKLESVLRNHNKIISLRNLAIIGALAGSAAVGATIYSTGGNQAPRPSASITTLSPDAARMAIASGLSCKIKSVEGKVYTYSDGTTQVPATLEFNQTPRSADARQQYAHSPAVLWRDETINAVPYKRGANGQYVQSGQVMTDVIAGETDNGNFDGVMVSTSEAKAGDAFLVESRQDVETGQGPELRETVSEAPCGVIAKRNGSWITERLTGLPTSMSIQTLIPPQAQPFDPASQLS